MRIISLIITLLISINLSAQQAYTGIVSDNFVSSNLASYNPSSIVDSKTKFAISTNTNLSRISNFCSQDYIFYGTDSKYIATKKNGYKNSYRTNDLLNIKFELNHQNALAYSFRIRSFDNLTLEACIIFVILVSIVNPFVIKN